MTRPTHTGPTCERGPLGPHGAFGWRSAQSVATSFPEFTNKSCPAGELRDGGPEE